MKIWEIVPKLKNGQSIKSKDTGNIYTLRGDTLHSGMGEPEHYTRCHLALPFFRQEWELVPNYITFEEALKHFKEGKRIIYHADRPEYNMVFDSSNAHVSALSINKIVSDRWSVEEDSL